MKSSPENAENIKEHVLEELESHVQIDEMLEFQDLQAASDWLRCDINDFLDASDSPLQDNGSLHRPGKA